VDEGDGVDCDDELLPPAFSELDGGEGELHHDPIDGVASMLARVDEFEFCEVEGLRPVDPFFRDDELPPVDRDDFDDEAFFELDEGDGTSPGTNPGSCPGTNPGTSPGTCPGTCPGTSSFRASARQFSPADSDFKP